MAGAFSGHLLNSYQSCNQHRGPFGYNNNNTSPGSPSISTCGAMSFNPQMHGNQASFSLDSQPSYMDLSQATADKIERLQAKLNQKLGPEYISQRPGPGGGPKLTYAEGWKIINLANEVFGFNGWSSSVVSLTVDFIDFNEESRRYTIGVTSIIRVTLRDGVFHEDIGYGMLENSKSKGAALDKCKKEAVTDGLKRALRNFGNLLGNCLYDKSYTAEVIKIKVSPPKFDRNELHRRPEFDESTSNTASTSTSTSTPNQASSSSRRVSSNAVTSTKSPHQIKLEQHGPNQPLQGSISKPFSSLPHHMRSEVHAATSTPNTEGKASAISNPSAGAIPTQNNAVHQPPHQMTHQPQEQMRVQPQAGRRVSFAETPPQEDHAMTNEFGEDSFTLTSEDDAFLAAVDLGEGDLGRPILNEDCMDFEEGLGRLDVGNDECFDENAGVNGSAAAPREPVAASSNIGMQDSSNQLQAQAPRVGFNSNQTADAAVGFPAGVLQDQRPARFTSNSSSNTSLGQGSGSNTSKVSSGHSWSNQNHNPATTNTALKRSATPSAGSFHFPPGMNPLGVQARLGPMQRPSGTGRSSAAGIGQKRTADTMQGPARRPVQGMGLGHQPGGSGVVGGRREPLARLDLGENGEVKRMKL